MAAKTMEEIAALLAAVKFKKRLFGGVDEDDVLSVLEHLQAEYRSVVEATEQRYAGLLEERNAALLRRQKELAQLKAQLADLTGPHGSGDAGG